MPSVWRVEFQVIDGSGEACEWLSGRSEAIAKAREIGGAVEKVTEYLADREVIFDTRDSFEEPSQ